MFSADRLKSFVRAWIFEHARPEVWFYIQHLARSRTAFYFPTAHRTVISAQVAKKRLLVLAPHPDDEVIGLGGTLSMHLTAKSDVLVLYMTTGGKASPNASSLEMQATRHSEAERVAQTYGFRPVFWEHKDQSLLMTHSESIGALQRLLQEWQPDEIFLPSIIDAHIDHLAANLILAAALAASGDHGNVTVFGYEVATDLSFPNYIMDITQHLHQKTNMLTHYRSQTELINYHRLTELRGALNHARYINPNGEGYAEAFFYFPAPAFLNIVKSVVSVLPESPVLKAFSIP